MWKSKLIGWKLVYEFTLKQAIKSKSVRIMTIILCIIALLSLPVVKLISSFNKDEGTVSNIEKVYIIDESGLGLVDYREIAVNNEQYQSTTFESAKLGYEEIINNLINNDTDKNSILLHIISSQGSYQLQFIKSPNGSVNESDLGNLSSAVTEVFNRNRINTLGITEEQLKTIYAPIETEVNMISINGIGTGEGIEEGTGVEDGSNNQSRLSMEEYYLMLAVIVIVVIFFAFGGESVASSIITEKSTRVIEYLMISIRPMAIIIGKVLAMLTVTLLQFAMIGCSIVISNAVSKAIFPNNGSTISMLNGIFNEDLLANITPINIILSVLLFISGFLFFALLAGLTGATVSKIEELAEGIMVFNTVLIIGAYLGIAVAIMNISGGGSNILSYIAYVLPISAVFVTPIFMFFGKVSMMWGILSLLSLIISLILLLNITAKIYHALILHNGSRLKIKDLITISKEAKEEK